MKFKLSALSLLLILAWGNPGRYLDHDDRCITYGNDLAWCVPAEYRGPTPFAPFGW